MTFGDLQMRIKKRLKSGLVRQIAAVAVILLCWLTPVGFAQTSTDVAPRSPGPVNAVPLPPTASEDLTATGRLLPDQWMISPGSIKAAPIYLDGRTLFWVSAPAVAGQLPAEDRAQEIQRRLYSLVQQAEGSLTVTVEVDGPSQLPVIFVNNQQLLTVTELDARLSGHASPSDRAAVLQADLQTAFRLYQAERQPGYLRRQIQVAGAIMVMAILLQALAHRLRGRLKQRQIRLANAKTQIGQTSTSGRNPVVEAPTFAGFGTVVEQLKARFDNRQKRKINEVERGLLILFEITLWMSNGLWILALFPYSRWLSTLLLEWMKIPGQILLMCGLAYLTVRLSGLIIDKAFLALQEGTRWAPDKSRRLSLRFSTFSQVAKGVVGAAIFAVLVLVVLAIAGVQVGPLLAGAGIIGVGISLAAQSLIKDFINGLLILFEDHYGIGDVITVEGLTGSVEYVNLRMTQIRDIEGRLITIPNSQINIVQNLSKDWAQVDLSVKVSPATDLSKALMLLKETATELSQEADWQRLILEPPDILGINAMDYTGVTLRLLLKTQPLQQWPVAFELRQRIKQAFDQAGITMGMPQEQVELRWEPSSVDVKVQAVEVSDARSNPSGLSAPAGSPQAESARTNAFPSN